MAAQTTMTIFYNHGQPQNPKKLKNTKCISKQYVLKSIWKTLTILF